MHHSTDVPPPPAIARSGAGGCLALTATALALLLAGAQTARAQGAAQPPPITVNIAGEFPDDDTNVGGSLSAALTAVPQGAPIAGDETRVDGPTWAWSANVTGSVKHADGTTGDPTPDDYSVEWVQEDDSSPYATLTVTFNTAGTYQVQAEAVVTYKVNGAVRTGDSGLVQVDAMEGSNDDEE